MKCQCNSWKAAAHALYLLGAGAALFGACVGNAWSQEAAGAASSGWAASSTRSEAARDRDGADKKAAPAGKKTAQSADNESAGKKAAQPADVKAIEVKPPDTAAAAPAKGEASRFEDWVLKCDGGAKGPCALMQRLADPKGRKIVQFTAAKSAKTLFMEVSAPLGLSIPHGITLVFPDKTDIAMRLVDCGLDGCRAVVALDEALRSKLESVSGFGVRFQDSKSGKVLTVNGSLRGFASGIKRVAGTE